jgi:hypothetical protein
MRGLRHSKLVKAKGNSLWVTASRRRAQSGLFAWFACLTAQFHYLRNRFFQVGHTEKNEDAWSGIISMQTSFDRRSLEQALRTFPHETKIPAEQLPQESPRFAGVTRPKFNIRKPLISFGFPPEQRSGGWKAGVLNKTKRLGASAPG